MKNKMLISEQTSLDMVKAYNVGCFSKYSWFTIGSAPQPKQTKSGKLVITGTNQNNEIVIFYPDGSVKNIITQKTATWKCSELEETKSLTADDTKLSVDQKKYLDDLVKYESSYSSTKPSDYEVDKTKYEVIDLNTLNPKLFPVTGKFFVWKRTGDISISKEQQDIIKKELETAGYTMIEPDVTSYLHDTEQDIRTILGGKYAKYYKSYVPVWQTEKLQKDVESYEKTSEEVRQRMKEGIVDRSTCRAAINDLYNSYKYPGRVYFQNDREILAAKIVAKKCATQGKQFLGKLEDRLNFLRGLKHKFGLVESTDSLDNVITETLKESIKNKKVLIKESEQVSKRINRVISEDNENIIDDILHQVKLLKSSGFKDETINEGIGDMFSSILGNTGSGVVQYLKFKASAWLLETLNVDPNTWAGEIITQTFANLQLKDYGRFFTDCKFTSELLAQSLAEGAANKFMKARGLDSPLYDILLQSSAEAFFNSEMVDSIEKRLYTYLCPKLTSVKDKAVQMTGDK